MPLSNDDKLKGTRKSVEYRVGFPYAPRCNHESNLMWERLMAGRKFQSFNLKESSYGERVQFIQYIEQHKQDALSLNKPRRRAMLDGE